jgi:hypothetical protein
VILDAGCSILDDQEGASIKHRQKSPCITGHNILKKDLNPYAIPGNKMGITDPFKNITGPVRKRALILFFILTIVLLTAMNWLDAGLKTEAAPSGIISFELADSLEHSRRITASWGPDGKVRAALSLGLDYFFLVAYALFIALACSQIAKALQANSPNFAAVGYLLAWAQFPAAALDAFENAALIHLLLGSSLPPLPLVARWCALIKFSLVGAGLIYIIGTGLVFLATKLLRWRARQKRT